VHYEENVLPPLFGDFLDEVVRLVAVKWDGGPYDFAVEFP
jgi:hypothetical protein